MAEKPTFAHSPIHVLPSIDQLRAKKAATMGRIAITVEKAVRESQSKKK